jgi:tetratricopeptide (TPR) repeat protein
VLIEEGRLDEAQAAFREMEELGGRTGHKQLLADAKSGMAQVQRLQGKPAEARQNAAAALDLWVATVERQQAAAGRLALARLAIDQGRFEEADREARQAVEAFRLLHLADGEALAREALAQIFLARGQEETAQQEIGRAQELVASSQNRRVRLTVEIAAGRTAGAQGRLVEARKTLMTTRSEAQTLGLRLSELDAAFGLAELDLRQGSPSGPRALQLLSQEATRQGVLLVANRAETLLRGIEVVAKR